MDPRPTTVTTRVTTPGPRPLPLRPRQFREPVQTDAMVATACGTLAYTVAGRGEALLLIHGLGTTRRTWRKLIASLATQYTVIVPDLPGHGDSGPPAGDYSLGAHATALRDLLVALGHQRATVIGHSLGGGVAMQFAYQFPDRTSRLILISSGGFGAELTILLRAAALPGAQAVVAVIGRLPELLTRLGLTVLSAGPGLLARQDVGPLAVGLRGLAESQQRRTFVRTARSVIDWHGQTVSASERIWLLAELPVLLAWGSNDKIIPALITG